MKKSKLKAILIALIIVICLNIGAYAAYVLSATDITYTKSDGTTVSVKEALDELHTIQPLAKAVSVGDYVAYDATSNYSYTPPKGSGSSSGAGATGGETVGTPGNSVTVQNQTFTSSSSIKWRVLGWDDETGGVVLISEGSIKTDAGDSLYLRGAIGYLYAEKELNNICAIYGHGTGANTSKTFNFQTGDVINGTTVGTLTGSGARSINVDDVNKICNITLSRALGGGSYGKAYTKSIYYPTTSQSTGYSTTATSRTDVSTEYYYIGSDYLSSSSESYKLLFRNTYWLATRCVSSSSNSSGYFVHYISGDSKYYTSLGYGRNSTFEENTSGNGVRPIVYLKSSIQTNGKNSSGAWTIIDK